LSDINAITVDTLRSRGVTQSFLAREAQVPPYRLQRALNGSGLGWLEPEEQQRVLRVLVRLRILEGAGA